MKTDWNQEAVKAANYIGKEMFQAHRGAMRWHNRILIAFGRAMPDEWGPQFLESLRRRMDSTNLAPAELGFGLTDEPGIPVAWAMVLRCNPAANAHKSVDWLNATVWAAWNDACGIKAPQTIEVGSAPTVGGIQGHTSNGVIACQEHLAGLL